MTFGSVTARYFTYAQRGFPYASPEEALARGDRARRARSTARRRVRRALSPAAADEIAQRLSEFSDADRAPRGDRRQPLHHAGGRGGRLPGRDAHADRSVSRPRIAACERFMAAIEAANEPPIERWPHFITKLPGAARGSAMPARGSGVPRRADPFVRWRRVASARSACIHIAAQPLRRSGMIPRHYAAAFA